MVESDHFPNRLSYEQLIYLPISVEGEMVEVSCQGLSRKNTGRLKTCSQQKYIEKSVHTVIFVLYFNLHNRAHSTGEALEQASRQCD